MEVTGNTRAPGQAYTQLFHRRKLLLPCAMCASVPQQAFLFNSNSFPFYSWNSSGESFPAQWRELSTNKHLGNLNGSIFLKPIYSGTGSTHTLNSALFVEHKGSHVHRDAKSKFCPRVLEIEKNICHPSGAHWHWLSRLDLTYSFI